MKKLLLLLLCVPLIGLGQEWTFGGTDEDNGHSVQQTTDGGYIITGHSEWHVYLIKTDGNGDSLWTKTYGGTGAVAGRSVQQTTDGGYIIAGGSPTSWPGDAWLLKTDGNGDSLWTKTFGGLEIDEGRSVQQTTDGGYIITGHTMSFGSGFQDVYLIKTDGSGNELWSQTFGGPLEEEGYSVQQTTDGGYIITGWTRSFGTGGHDVYLIKTDGNGDSLWTKTYGETGIDVAYSVQQTTDGGYIITGRTGSDVYLIKTDGNGVEQWSQTFGGLELDEGRSVQQTTDGGYIIAGYTMSFANGYRDVYLIKTDGNGDSLWTKTYGGTGLDEGYSVQQTTDGGYIITGYTRSFGNGGHDVYLIKTDGNGNVTTEFSIPINSNRELEKVVDILGRDINPEKNKPFIEIYNDGTVKKKIIIE